MSLARGRQGRRNGASPGVLIIVQNLPVPFDRRVWLECQALREDGYRVAVVCPKAPGDPRHEVVDGVDLFKYQAYGASRSQISFVAEYAYSFLMTLWSTVVAWRRVHFDIIQTCNPPDIFWPIGLVFRLLGGTYFVFDQHDLCPELYESRFPGREGATYRGLRWLEWCTYHTADHVIATNNSYRAKAMDRGGKQDNEITVVRTGPDPDRLRRGESDVSLRRGRDFLVAYLGVMGPQDGVDIVLQAAAVLVHDLHRRDVSFTLMGTGDSFPDLLALRAELGLEDYVEFTGRAPDELVFRVLSTADVGLSPDPRNPLNELSTMNKTMEYMAFELPVVAFDLRETRVSAAGAAVYAEPNDIGKYARAIVELLDDEPRRRAMGQLGRSRVEEQLAWCHQRGRYVGVYDNLLAVGV
ncbi:MAG: glycosyltransferase family 4 protein [Actinomycetota bacterium]|nr:glycosyltransferase family 4 protein [Actinomycetota bacterium]